jgi:hypothetical protein
VLPCDAWVPSEAAGTFKETLWIQHVLVPADELLKRRAKDVELRDESTVGSICVVAPLLRVLETGRSQ